MKKADESTHIEQPFSIVGPAMQKGWVARASANSTGCTYINNEIDNCPAIEFIRIQPSRKTGCSLPFYLSTTNVTFEQIAALLDNSNPSAGRANLAMRHLNATAPVGASFWKFSPVNGIELSPEDYEKYFPLAPVASLPIQQITPQTAMYFARLLGCRLPTSAEWQAAWMSSTNNSNEEIKLFANSAWKLRDADFLSLEKKAAVKSSPFPDEGAFLGAHPEQIQTGSKAAVWQKQKLLEMGGWALGDELKTENSARLANFSTLPADFRADLIDQPNNGFRPVGATHHVLHDLLGNVAEFVLDAPDRNRIESRPVMRCRKSRSPIGSQPPIVCRSSV